MSHKILIFVPAFGQIITATTFLTTHAIREQMFAKGIQGGISTLSFPDIAELRGMALTIWYDTIPDSSHILFIDADMGFPPEMVTDMILFDEPIIGSIYPQRKLPLSWAGSGTGQPVTERRGNFMLVEGVGFGCTLIKREVVTKMIERYPELIDSRLALHPAGETLRGAGTNRLFRFFEKMDIPDRGLISEDLSFCIRWNTIVGKPAIWAAIGYKMSHVGPFDFQGRYLDQVEQMQQQATVQQASLPTAPSIAQSNGGTATGEDFALVASGPRDDLNGGDPHIVPPQAAPQVEMVE